MNYCTSCGSQIPDGKRSCSMCYGDPYYGKDEYYLRYLEQQEQDKNEREYYEEQQELDQNRV